MTNLKLFTFLICPNFGEAYTDKTGGSLTTVNNVAKITHIDYVQKNRRIGLKVSKRRKFKEKQNLSILRFLNESYSNWRKSKLNSKWDKRSVKEIIQEFQKHQKTITLPEDLKLNQFEKIYEYFIKEITLTEEEEKKKDEAIEIKLANEKEKIRLKKIENEKIRLEKIENEKASKRRKKKEEAQEKKRALEEKKKNALKHKILLKKQKFLLRELLRAGINPFGKEWDTIPDGYNMLQYKSITVASFWYDDQSIMFSIRKDLPDYKQHAYNNVKIFNEERADKLVQHYKVLRYNKNPPKCL